MKETLERLAEQFHELALLEMAFRQFEMVEFVQQLSQYVPPTPEYKEQDGYLDRMTPYL